MAGLSPWQANAPMHKPCHDMFFFVFQLVAFNDRLRPALVLSPAGDAKLGS
jgi:hypothetical protein